MTAQYYLYVRTYALHDMGHTYGEDHAEFRWQTPYADLDAAKEAALKLAGDGTLVGIYECQDNLLTPLVSTGLRYGEFVGWKAFDGTHF